MLSIVPMPPGVVDHECPGLDTGADEFAVMVPAVWFGSGLVMLDIPVGAPATEQQVRMIFSRLEHPTRPGRNGAPLPLGSRPATARAQEERVAQAFAAEPDAIEERRAEIRRQVHLETSKETTAAYYDMTFSPVKSVSVYLAATLDASRHSDVESVVAAHHSGVAAAMAFLEREASYVRSGYYGKSLSGRSVGVFEETRGLVWLRRDGFTCRAGHPHLHSKVALLNRTETASDGVIRALVGEAFEPVRNGAIAIYQQTYERKLSALCRVVFASGLDGEREIMGFSPKLLRHASCPGGCAV